MPKCARLPNAAIWLVFSALVWALALSTAGAKSARGTPNASPPLAQYETIRARLLSEVNAAVWRAARPQAPQAPQPQQPGGPPVPDAQGYVGEQACVECHDAQKGGYYESTHHRDIDPRTPAAQKACETCHGPTGRHAEDPVLYPIPNDFKKMKPDQVSELCATCHNRGDHALWEGSQHESRGVTCTSCHSMHAYKSEEAQLVKASQLQVCATCHRDKSSKLDRSGHMPVREGKMQCTTCHNVHGTTNVRLLRAGDSIAELCTSCHADKRGPFIWEHAPSRDGCVTCHDPHGSSNERMLVVKTPMLCQRCHVFTRHPSTIYDAALVQTSVRVYARSCVTCHAAIHGSNHPSGQRFVR